MVFRISRVGLVVLLGVVFGLSMNLITLAGEQVWFLLKHGERFERGKLSRKMAWGMIHDYMRRNHRTDVRFFQVMEFYKVYGIGLDKTLGLSKARAEAILNNMVCPRHALADRFASITTTS